MHESLDAEMKAEHLRITSVYTPWLHRWRPRINLEKHASAICLNALSMQPRCVGDASKTGWRDERKTLVADSQNFSTIFLKSLKNLVPDTRKRTLASMEERCWDLAYRQKQDFQLLHVLTFPTLRYLRAEKQQHARWTAMDMKIRFQSDNYGSSKLKT